MDAFLKIGVEKSASLPVVAPAIGEALIATAFGLVAAIPATIAYNYIDKRIGDLLRTGGFDRGLGAWFTPNNADTIRDAGNPDDTRGTGGAEPWPYPLGDARGVFAIST